MLVKESQQNKKVLILSTYRYNLSETNELIQMFLDSKLEVLLPNETKKLEFDTIDIMRKFAKKAFNKADYIYVHNIDDEVEPEHMSLIYKAIKSGKTVYFSRRPNSRILDEADQDFYDQTMIIEPDVFASLVIYEDDVWRQRQFVAECKQIQKEA